MRCLTAISTRLLIAVCLFPAFAVAEPTLTTLITNIAGRSTISLDGTWNAIVDPYETGVHGRFFQNAKPRDKRDLVEYNFDASEKLKVPGDWNTQRDTLLFYEGPVWYQRYFPYAKRPHTRLFLYFGAANYAARVWLNGQKLGEHIGGFTPFNLEITGNVAEGENSIVVEVNNTRLADGVPALNTDWWSYGGLTRSVELVEVPDAFIQDYLVQLAKGSRDEIAGWVQLNGAPPSSRVTVEIPEANVRQSSTTDATGRAEFHFPAKLQLWSPENPKLYQVVISAGNDTLKDEIGFRSIETRGTQILLNGKPIFLRGISMHEEAPFRGGRAFAEEDDAVLLGWARDLGCNLVRLAHYPYNEAMIRLADRMGLLVWSEIPVYWSIAWKNPDTLENAKEQLRDEIARDRNRASVIFWSMSNETPPSEPGRTEFIKSLAEYTRQLDSTRLVTSAMNHTELAEPGVRSLNDPLGESLDVLGLNEYVGWYDGKLEDANRLHWKTAYEKPLIISEFGADAPYGKHGDADTLFTEEYQANLFEHQINMLKQIPSLAGMSPWVLMDFRSPRRFLPGVQDFHNRKGLISDRGQRKQAFYVLQKYYQQTQSGK
jgi:beta-glucuronidase